MAWTYICAAIPGDTTSDQQPIWNAGLKNTGMAKRTRRSDWVNNLEIVAAVELATIDEARALEREMKRKKKSTTGLGLVAKPVAIEQPEVFGVGPGVRVPANPRTLRSPFHSQGDLVSLRHGASGDNLVVFTICLLLNAG